ncbi:MAG: Ig-like domain-containing protein [Verrucomicrobiae bacterium]|nr:Ig-like domain-containing protein [Verrucomicrobiae bacterium]
MKIRTLARWVTVGIWLAFLPQLQAATLTWTNNVSGSWHEPGNWSPNQVPGAADIAVLNRYVTVTVTNNVTSAELQFRNGTLSITNGVLATTTFTWTGGTLRGAVQCGEGTIGSGTSKTLVGGQLVNVGTLTWSDSFAVGSSSWDAGNAGVISNLTGGVINITTDLTVGKTYDPGVLYNHGTINKTGGTGTTTFSGTSLANHGRVNINSGKVNFASGGSSTGTFLMQPEAALSFSSNYEFTDGSSVGGGGDFAVTSGTLNFNGTAQFTNTVLRLAGGSVNFNNVESGVVQVTTLAMTGGGTLGGTNAIHADTFTWTGGRLHGVVQCGEGTIGSGTSKTLVGGQLVNVGTLTWSDSFTVGSSSRDAGNAGVISNLTGGVINITTDLTVGKTYDPGVLYNHGTINKTGGTGTTTFSGTSLVNHGSININSGTLNFNWGGSSSGSVTVAADCTLRFDGGTFTLAEEATVSGAGNLWVSGGTANFNGDYSLTGTNSFTSGNTYFNGLYQINAAINITGGNVYFNNAGVSEVNVPTVALAGGGTLGGTNAVTAADFTWTGGWLRTVLTCGGGSIGGGNTKYLVGGVLINAGALEWSDSFAVGSSSWGAGNAGVISNLTGGVINITTDLTVGNTYDPGVLYNHGTINKTGGTGTTTFSGTSLANHGRVNINSGKVNFASGGSSTGTFLMQPEAALSFSSNYEFTDGSSVGGGGDFAVTGGTLNFNGTAQFTNTVLRLAGGSVNFNNVESGVVQVTTLAMTGGGTLGGTNAIHADTFTWTGGRLHGVVQCGEGTIGSGTSKTLVGGQLVNVGTLTWSDSFTVGSSSRDAGNAGVISNLTGGVINITTDLTVGKTYDPGVLYNHGTINKTGGTGTTTFSGTSLVNHGSININSGTLNFNWGGSSSGSVTVAADCTLRFDGGTFTLAEEATVSGAGNLWVSGGTANFNGDYSLTGTNSFTSGNTYFNGLYQINAAINITGGNVYFNNAGVSEVNVPTVALAGGGTLGGTNAVTAADFTWTGGWLRTVLTCGGGSIGGGNTKYLVGGVLINAGALEWSDSFAVGSSSWGAGNAGVISNLTGGVINITTDLTVGNTYDPGVLYNHGTINKTGGTGTTTFSGTSLANHGRVNINSGKVNFASGGSSTGTFLMQPEAALSFSSNYEFTDGSSVGGGGDFAVTGGTLNFNGTAQFTNTVLRLAGGSVNFNNVESGVVQVTTLAMTGGGTLGGTNAIHADTFTWTGGRLHGVVQCGEGTIGSGTSKTLVGGQLVNVGTLTWSDSFAVGSSSWGAGNAGVISNLVGGVINITSDLTVSYTYDPGVLYNHGTINKTGGTGTTTFSGTSLVNHGSININSGRLNVAAGGSSSGSFLIQPGTILSFSSSYDFDDGSSLGGSGEFIVTAGTANFTGTAQLTNSIVSLAGGSANFNNPGGGAVRIGNLNLTGSGTLGGTNTVTAANLTWTGGRLRGVVQCGGGLIGSGSTKYLTSGALINAGTLTWSDGFYLSTSGYGTGDPGVLSNLVSGVINITGDFGPNSYFDPGLIYNLGEFNKIAGDGVANVGSYFDNLGTLAVRTGAFNFTQNGGLLPHNGTLAFDLGVSNTFGRITASGTVGLNGTLEVTAHDDYMPTVGDRFDLLTAGQRTNFFERLNLGQFPGIAWQLSYAPTVVTLTALAASAGPVQITGRVTDFNAQPVGNLVVYAFNSSGTNQYYVSTLTDGGGYYRLGVTNGSWRVGVQGAVARGYDDPVVQDVVLNDANGTANFVLAPYSGAFYSITAANQPPDAGTVTGAGNYYADTTNTLTAVAGPGYYFTNWTENGVVIGTSNVLTFVANTNRHFVAHYGEANTYHVVTLATTPAELTAIVGAGTYTNGETATFVAPPRVLSGTSNYFFQHFALSNVTVSTQATYQKTFSTLDATHLAYVAVYTGIRTNPVIQAVATSRFGVVPTNDNFTLTFRFDRTMDTNIAPVVTLTNIVAAGIAPTVAGNGTWSGYWRPNDSYTTPALAITNGMDGTNLVYVANASDTNGGVLLLTNAYTFAVDTIYPTLTEISATPAINTAAISWQSGEPASTVVDYGLTTAYGATAYGSASVTNHTVTLYNLTALTTYHYRVRSADAAGNETVAADATFTTLAAPDLLVADLAVTGALQSGGALTITWADTNAGPMATDQYWYDRVTISNLTTGIQLLDTYQYYNPAVSGNIAAGAAQARALNFTLPDGDVGVGQLQITVVVDAYNHQYEFNLEGTAESNNRASLTVTSVLATYPDLQVTELAVTNAPLHSGDSVHLVWRDQNSGLGAVTNVFADRISVVNATNGQVLVNTLLPYDPALAEPIAAGGAVPRAFSFTLPDGSSGAGEFLVTVTADAAQQVYEYNAGGTGELNNTNSITINATLAAYPDLIITNLTAPLAANAGQTIQVVWTDVNQGSAPITNAWFDQVFLSSVNALGGGQWLATRSVTNVLAAGDSLVLTQAVTLPPFVTGDQWLIVKGNVAANFYELNSTNNSTLAAAPLHLTSTLQLTLSPTNVLESAGSQAVLATLLRNGDLANALTVDLSSSLTNLLLPAAVVIPAGQSATNFHLGVVDNLISGDTASGVVTASAGGYPTVNVPLTITDDDPPLLTLHLSVNQIPEDAGVDAVSALITRNAHLDSALVVNITSDHPEALLAPETVVIPAGNGSAVFALTPVPDGELNSGRRVRVTAVAAGYPSISAGLDVLNADVVTLALTLADSVVSEGAGAIATVGTVSRGVMTPQAQKVQLTRTGSELVTVPSLVTIPANATSTTFNVGVGTDGLVTGNQTAVITANPLNLANNPQTAGAAQATLQVLDTNGPSLRLELAQTVISKGSNTMATLTRNTAPTNALIVTLASSPTGVVTHLPVVELAVNQTSTNFPVTGILDAQQTGNREVVLSATAAGYNSAARTLTVSDIYLPDLVSAVISAPTEAFTEQQVSVSWQITNHGLGSTTNQNWFDYVYLASDSVGGGQMLVAAKPNVRALAVGESYTNTASFYLPALPGNFWLLIEANGNRSLTELKTVNNTAAAASPLTVHPAYRAELLDVSPLMAGAGTPIVLQGRTFNSTNNTSVPNRVAAIRVMVNDTRRTFQVTSDATGNFTYTFQPLANEVGYYTASADHPNVTNQTTQASFALLGMAALPDRLAPQLLPNTPVTGSVLLTNRTGYALTDLTVTQPDLGTNLSVAFTFTNHVLPPYGVMTVDYTLNSPLTQAAQANFAATFTSAEGAALALPLYVKIVPTFAQLVATPAYLERGMVRGEQTVVAFTIANTGGSASGDLTVQLPDLPWLSLGSTANIPSIPAGSNAVVTLLLNPATDLTLGLYNGNIAVANENVGVRVPYQFRAVSSGIGDLVVNVTDDYTYYVAGEPKVTNALVVVRDPFTGGIIAQTNSGPTGTAQFSALTEGSYTVDVTAEKHNQFRGSVLVAAGITNAMEAFLPRQLVTYQWSVVPTEIQDHYRIVLESVFETEVPVPNVVIEEPQVMVLVAAGEVTQFEIKLTNQGLIAANDVEIEVPDHPTYLVTPLVRYVGKLPAKSSVTIPVTVQMRAAPGGALAGGQSDEVQAAGDEGCTLEDLHACLPKIPLSAKYSYPCGNRMVGQSRRLDLSIICTANDVKACLEGFKELIESANLLSVGCNAINALLACGGADLTPCQEAAISAACGAAVGAIAGGPAGALAGAASAGAGGLLECICSHLDVIPLPSGSSRIHFLPFGYAIGGSPVITATLIPGVDCRGSGAPAAVPGQAIITHAGYNAGSAPRIEAPVKAQDGAGVCAQVRLRINQEVTLTRSAFAGTLEIDNGGSTDITGVQVTLDFRDGAGQSAVGKFVTEGPVVTGMTAVDGSGVLAGGATGRAVYTFIPTTDAAPDQPYSYQIGGTLRYLDAGQEVIVPLLSAPITVYPEAKLDLVYFQQRDVYGDDPFTPATEPSEPYTLGLIVKNIGAGDARNFEITSAQPQIIENEKGLLIDFRIIGTSVGSNAVAPSLTARLGDVPAGVSKSVNWQLLSTLQGKFISFAATFEHVDGLGHTNLSLINSVETHELIHPVRANRPADDGVLDYLVNDFADPQNLPDLLYHNTGAIEPVNVVTNGVFNGSVGPAHWQVQLTAAAGPGWNYYRLPDPGPGYLLASVVRSDGKVLELTNNAWTTDRSFPSSIPGAVRENLLHLFDWEGSGQYTLTYRSTNTTTPAIVQFGPVTPFNQTEAVDAVTIVFSAAMDLATFNFADLELTRDGGPNLITPASGVSVVLLADATYRITGLVPLTAEDGNYSLRIFGNAISDVWGNRLGDVSAVVAWAKGDAAPVVESISAVTPDPRNQPIEALTIAFSKAINPATFGLGALQLTRDGGPNLITADVTLTTEDNINFTLAGLGTLTGEEGTYVLSVTAANVTDAGGKSGQGTQTRTWTMITSPPHIVELSPVTTNPRNIVVQNLTVTFSHAVDPATFDHHDLTLTRDGGPDLINADVTLTRLTPTTYQIGEISWLQGWAGSYTLTVDAAGIQDWAGNPGVGSTNVSWTMILDTPATPDHLAIAPDLGFSATDGLTSTNAVTLSGTVTAPNLTVRVFDTTTSIDFGLATMEGTNFSASLLFASDGTHRLRVTAIDGAGNVSLAAFVTVVIDQIPPSATIEQIATPTDADVNTVTVTFTEAINALTVSSNNFALVWNGTNPFTPAIQVVASNRVQLVNLAALTAAAGEYTVVADLRGITDLAGNPATDQLAMSWERQSQNQPPYFVEELSDLVITPDGAAHRQFLAEDPNGDALTFSLIAAPDGAMVVATNGVFWWQPTRTNASTIHSVTVQVTDQGNPPLSAHATFNITVLDYLEVQLSETNLLGGASATLPVFVASSEGVTNLSFALPVPMDVLTNWTLTPIGSHLDTAELQLDPSQLRIHLQAPPGQTIQGTQQVAQLQFTAAPDGWSQFVRLVVTNLAGYKPGDHLYTNHVNGVGRAVVVQRHPLLEGWVTPDQTRQLAVYGRPGTNYQLQVTDSLMPPVIWEALLGFQQTNVLVPLSLPATNTPIFYQLKEIP